MFTILHAVSLAAFGYFCASTFYFLVAAVASFFHRKSLQPASPRKRKIAILIPAFKEDAIIHETTLHALAHDYPADRFKVFVIADSMKPETIQRLRNTSAEVLEVRFAVSTKAKAIHAALQEIPAEGYTIGLILDADNIMSSGCLEKINNAFNNGAMAAQCHRTAKNKNTPLALLDSINEEVNNVLFRKGQHNLGFTVSSAGSGIAIEFNLFRELFSIQFIRESTAEDKEIDMQLIKRNIKVKYLHDALVLDEKISSSEAFNKQRLRWLEAHVTFLLRFFSKDFRKTSKTGEYWNKLLHFYLLPRTLYFLGITLICVITLIEMMLDVRLLYPASLIWLIVAFIHFAVLCICIPKSFYTLTTLRSLFHIPILIYSMLKTLTKIKLKRKEFIHTPKAFTMNNNAS